MHFNKGDLVVVTNTFGVWVVESVVMSVNTAGGILYSLKPHNEIARRAAVAEDVNRIARTSLSMKLAVVDKIREDVEARRLFRVTGGS